MFLGRRWQSWLCFYLCFLIIYSALGGNNWALGFLIAVACACAIPKSFQFSDLLWWRKS